MVPTRSGCETGSGPCGGVTSGPSRGPQSRGAGGVGDVARTWTSCARSTRTGNAATSARVEWADPEIEYALSMAGPGSGAGIAAMARAGATSSMPGATSAPMASEYRELDDERVLVLAHVSGRGKTSGARGRADRSQGRVLFHVHDGKVTRLVALLGPRPRPRRPRPGGVGGVAGERGDRARRRSRPSVGTSTCAGESLVPMRHSLRRRSVPIPVLWNVLATRLDDASAGSNVMEPTRTPDAYMAGDRRDAPSLTGCA